mmetsp:Transcript_1985/g.5495  ORF Transcript_1985/g.5495 Transcript_1985/m.5495 type:complete len:200 (+) Transcript_1985:290-889(+)
MYCTSLHMLAFTNTDFGMRYDAFLSAPMKSASSTPSTGVVEPMCSSCFDQGSTVMFSYLASAFQTASVVKEHDVFSNAQRSRLKPTGKSSSRPTNSKLSGTTKPSGGGGAGPLSSLTAGPSNGPKRLALSTDSDSFCFCLSCLPSSLISRNADSMNPACCGASLIPTRISIPFSSTSTNVSSATCCRMNVRYRLPMRTW